MQGMGRPCKLKRRCRATPGAREGESRNTPRNDADVVVSNRIVCKRVLAKSSGCVSVVAAVAAAVALTALTVGDASPPLDSNATRDRSYIAK